MDFDDQKVDTSGVDDLRACGGAASPAGSPASPPEAAASSRWS